MVLGKKIKRSLIIALVVIVLIIWTVFLYEISPQKIVEKIGITNGYLLAFFAALLSGTTFILPTSYIFILTLSLGGLNPFILGFLAGVGGILGDSLTYYLGYKGKEVIDEHYKKFLNKVCIMCYEKPQWKVWLFLFVYGAIIPLPNNLVVIPLGLAHYPYKRLVIPLGLGNIVFYTLVAGLGYYGLRPLF